MLKTQMYGRHSQSEKEPIIFLTAHLRRKGPELSNLDPTTLVYPSKPYSKDDLVRAIRKLFPKN